MCRFRSCLEYPPRRYMMSSVLLLVHNLHFRLHRLRLLAIEIHRSYPQPVQWTRPNRKKINYANVFKNYFSPSGISSTVRLYVKQGVSNERFNSLLIDHATRPNMLEAFESAQCFSDPSLKRDKLDWFRKRD